MSKAAHTPTPWRRGIVPGSIVSDDAVDFDPHYGGRFVCESLGYKADTDLLITAVNHHQELVTRLTNLVNAVDNLTGSFDASTTPAVDLALTEARETLKKVIQ